MRTRTQSHPGFTQALTLAVALACLALVVGPTAADAAKPEVTGQERAASAGNKSTESDTAADTAAEDGAEDAEEEASTEQPKGLERAAQSVKREEIQRQLSLIMLLISQMKSAMSGGGIGQELSEYIKNGRVATGDDDTSDEESGAAPFAAVLGETTSDIDEQGDDDAANDVAIFTVPFDLTASGTALSILAAAATESSTSTGVVYSVRNASGTVVTTGTTTATLESTDATVDGDALTVAADDTATFTLTVTHDPEEGGVYYVQLESIVVGDEVYDLAPATDFASVTETL